MAKLKENDAEMASKKCHYDVKMTFCGIGENVEKGHSGSAGEKSLTTKKKGVWELCRRLWSPLVQAPGVRRG